MGTVVLMLAIACLIAPGVDAGEGKSFSLRDVDGPTAFDLDGFVTFGGNLVPAAAVGRFIADGRGNLTDGERTVMIGGSAVLRQEFTCTYVVTPTGLGSADCVIRGGPPESFDFVIVDKKKEAYFTSTSPGTVLRGRTTRQQ